MRRRLLILLFIPFFLLGGLIWLAGQEWALQWVAQKVVQAGDGGIEIEGVSGTLLGSLEIEKISLGSAERDIRIDRLMFEWNPWRLLQGRLERLADFGRQYQCRFETVFQRTICFAAISGASGFHSGFGCTFRFGFGYPIRGGNLIAECEFLTCL